MQRAKHSRFFGLDYSSPKRSNVFAGIKVSIIIVSAVCTLELLATPFPDTEAGRTGFGSVCGFDNDQLNPIQQSLVFQKATQLVERPLTEFGAELLSPSFGRESDSRQIFNGNSFALCFSALNNRLCNGMVNDGRSSFLPATKPFQEAFSPFSAFAFDRTTNLLPMFTISVKPLGRMLNPVRSDGNISKTKVYAYKFFNVLNLGIGNLNRLEQVKLSFLIHQIRFAFNVRQIGSIVANEGHLLPTTYAPNGNGVTRGVIENTTIIGNASKWPKFSFDFPVNFIRIGDFGNTPDNNLTTQAESGLNSVIRFFVNFELIENPSFPSYFGNCIASSIGFFDCFKEQFSLFFGWKKFDFKRQFHSRKDTKTFLYLKTY